MSVELRHAITTPVAAGGVERVAGLANASGAPMQVLAAELTDDVGITLVQEGGSHWRFAQWSADDGRRLADPPPAALDRRFITPLDAIEFFRQLRSTRTF